MSQVSPSNSDGLPVRQHPGLVPDDLLVPERRPPVRVRLLDERLESPAARSDEQEVPGVAVVEVDLPRGSRLLLEEVSALPVPAVLGVVPVVVADPVSRLVVARPPEVGLDGHGGGAVSLRCHHGLVAHYDGGTTVVLVAHSELGREGGEEQVVSWEVIGYIIIHVELGSVQHARVWGGGGPGGERARADKRSRVRECGTRREGGQGRGRTRPLPALAIKRSEKARRGGEARGVYELNY